MDFIEYWNQFKFFRQTEKSEEYIFYANNDLEVDTVYDHFYIYDFNQGIHDWYGMLLSLAGRTNAKHQITIAHARRYVKIYIWILED